MDILALTRRVDSLLGRDNGHSGDRVGRPLDGAVVLEHHHPTRLEASWYDPLFCLILQGEKVVSSGDRQVILGSGDGLLVSHALPVVSRVTVATPQAPYLALVLTIDLAMLRSLYDELADFLPDTVDASFAKVPVDAALAAAIDRYLALADDPVEARVLGPGMRRELHFRLLMSPTGGMLRALLRHDSHASQVARAIQVLRQDFRERLAVPELARMAGMSPSAFHKHFKEVTATTPLQYQKELRLLEARRLLTHEGRDVSEAAFAVGYESPTQFSREYRRKFGHPPSGDRRAAS